MVVAEFIGTFILLLIGCGSGFIDQKYNITIVGVAFAWGIVIMAMVYTLGHISGAHFNPAVTIAFAIVGRFPWKQVIFYVVAQVIGAILACLILRGLFNGDQAKVMLTLPAANTNDLTVIAWETVASFILMWVICGAASDHRAIKELSGAAVGAAIFLDVLIAGELRMSTMKNVTSKTKANLNPAYDSG
ncbi:uncharacterized protein A4U43_C08F21440 [Asparagus officinalis]|nr:uncharacterized protein A4U43_C08F21440 [Asparagus officinalis]